MVTKRKNLDKGLNARRASVREQAKNERLKLLVDCYATRFLHLIYTLKMKTGNTSRFLEAMNLEIVKRYQECKYGRPEIIKRSVETWLHTRRKNGEIDNSYIEKFIGKTIDTNQVFDANTADLTPWNVTHEVGKFLWDKTLKIMGVANAGEESQVFKVMNLSNIGQFHEFIADIEADRFIIHPAFVIDPGQTLNFEV